MTIQLRAVVAAGLLGLAVAAPASAQVAQAKPGQPEARTAAELMPGKAKLAVTTPAFKDGGDIPFENTQYRGNAFPGLDWSKGPAGTKSYVVIMQDNSLIYSGAPILHWTLFNIPPSVTKLPAGMAPDARPAGSAYGPNYKGEAKPYAGPRTPVGLKDHYHFQVFALGTTVPASASGSSAALTDAMKGHVLASGDVMGVGQAPPGEK